MHKLYIQCKEGDKVGSFIKNDKGELITPVFDNLGELFIFARKNGILYRVEDMVNLINL